MLWCTHIEWLTDAALRESEIKLGDESVTRLESIVLLHPFGERRSEPRVSGDVSSHHHCRIYRP
jgi:hypothetical protein